MKSIALLVLLTVGPSSERWNSQEPSFVEPSGDRLSTSGPVPIVRTFGYFDADEDIDFVDYQSFVPCFVGPAGFLPSGCLPGEGMADGQVDLVDLAKFFRAFEATVTTVAATSPMDGELDVAVSRECRIDFGQPIGEVLDGGITVWASGELLRGRPEIRRDGKRVWFRYGQELPEGSEIIVIVDGDLILDRFENLIDADDDGEPGGVLEIRFTTATP